MPFAVFPVDESDVNAITCIYLSVPQTSSLWASQLSNVPVAECDKMWRARAVLYCCKSPDPDLITVKAIDDDSGEIAAFAVWAFSKEAQAASGRELATLPRPPSINKGASQKADTGFSILCGRNEITDYKLLMICTAPAFRRRGAATTLVKWGLERAEREGKFTSLTASPEGFWVYKKCGFVEKDRIEWELADIGGSGTTAVVYMKWAPNLIAESATRQQQ